MKWTEQQLAEYLEETGATVEHMTVARAKEILQPGEFQVITPRKANKYSAKRVVHCCPHRGMLVFDSVGEHGRYLQLLQLERAGEISDLELQQPFDIADACPGFNVKVYRADFTYNEQGNDVIEDFKGKETDLFKLKWHLMHLRYGHMFELRLTRR